MFFSGRSKPQSKGNCAEQRSRTDVLPDPPEMIFSCLSLRAPWSAILCAELLEQPCMGRLVFFFPDGPDARPSCRVAQNYLTGATWANSRKSTAHPEQQATLLRSSMLTTA